MMLFSPDLLTCEHVTKILRQAGRLKAAHVVSLEYSLIGLGQMSDTYRFAVGYDRAEPGAPASLTGKFSPADSGTQAGGGGTGAYRAEVLMYQNILPRAQVRAPACYYAEIDSSGSKFGILMEDLGPARTVDQLTGCSRADAELVMRQAAALHAGCFDDASILAAEWLNNRQKVYAFAAPVIADYVKAFAERFEGLVAPDDMATIQAFAGNFDRLVKRRRHLTVVHGDFRLDNMLFDARAGEVPIAVFDWQGAGASNPALDLGFFMATSYPVEHRASDEEALVRQYHEHLLGFGVSGYDWDELWNDYRRAAWSPLFVSVFSSAIAKRSERGDRMFSRMASGGAAMMRDHKSLTLD